MRYIKGIPVWGDPVQNAVEQMANARDYTQPDHVALMADHHLGYGIPVGGVFACQDRISPSGVGFDIACGNMAAKLSTDSTWLKNNISHLMDLIFSEIEFGIGGKNSKRPDHDLFYDDTAWDIKKVRSLKDLARNQLGTVGAGNHYVDLFIDEENCAWVGVHFGSRGFGHKIASEYIKRAGGKDGIDAPPCLLDVDSADGQEYLSAMKLAGRYAYAGREWVCNRVANLLGAEIVDTVHNHHNFAWQELHGGRWLWVTRKGATPAWPGQMGFVGATMAEPSVILRGKDHPSSQIALYSTIHGAGRAMSRTEAAGRMKRVWAWRCSNRECAYEGRPRGKHQRGADGSLPRCPTDGYKMRWGYTTVVKKLGKIFDEERLESVKNAGVELRGGGNDESPRAYKRLDDVLDAHRDSVDVVNVLRPIGVAMAGKNVEDPYKD